MNQNLPEINLLEYWNILRKKIKFISVITVAGIILSVAYSLWLPRMYASPCRILSISDQHSPGIASMMGGGLNTLLNSRTSGDNKKFRVLLKSRALSRAVIEKLNLLPVLFKEQWNAEKQIWKSTNPSEIPKITDAITMMAGRVITEEEPTASALDISVEFEDPETAAMLSNEYTKMLKVFLDTNSLTLARRRRIFLEKQITLNKEQILTLGKELSKFYSDNNISDARSLMNFTLDLTESTNIPPLSGQLDVELQKLREKNDELRKKLVVENIPASIYFNYLSNYNVGLVSLQTYLAAELASAKIDEERQNLAFQIIDPAEPNSIPIKPRRRMIVILGTLGAFMAAILITFTLEYVSKLSKKETTTC